MTTREKIAKLRERAEELRAERRDEAYEQAELLVGILYDFEERLADVERDFDRIDR